jgi:hypothetical protein
MLLQANDAERAGHVAHKLVTFLTSFFDEHGGEKWDRNDGWRGAEEKTVVDEVTGLEVPAEWVPLDMWEGLAFDVEVRMVIH